VGCHGDEPAVPSAVDCVSGVTGSRERLASGREHLGDVGSIRPIQINEEKS
jgi:hypothetical protein